jgi:hypothetical protein
MQRLGEESWNPPDIEASIFAQESDVAETSLAAEKSFMRRLAPQALRANQQTAISITSRWGKTKALAIA